MAWRRERIIIPFLIIVVFFARTFLKNTPVAISSSPQNIHDIFFVSRVVDGDTIAARIHGTETKVRLIGLNTPETVDPRRKVECFGKEASDKAKEILTGKTVVLETDDSQSRYDKYGRLLAYVFLTDGTNFDEMMIREGYGHEYTYDTPYRYQKEFQAAEKEARENKRGLWSPNACR